MGASAHRVRRLLLWLGIAATLATLALRGDYTNDLAALLPAEDPVLGREVAFFEGRGATQVMAVEAWSQPPGRGDRAVDALRLLARDLAPLGARVVDPGGPESAAALAERIYRHLPALLTQRQLDEARERMRPERLAELLRAVKERASRPEDMFTAAAAREDVLGLAGFALQGGGSHLPTASGREGVLVHRDGEHHLLLLEVDFAPDDIGRTARLMSAIDAATAAAGADGVAMEAVGSYRHFRDNMESIRDALVASLPISIALIAALLWTLVRSWRAILAVHMPMVLSFAGALAALALLGRPIPLLMIGFASCFLGISVENSIHMTMALQAGEERRALRPLVISYLTTAVAFAVLIFSSVPALRCLGLMTVFGLLTALAASLWLLPALVPRGGTRTAWTRVSATLLRWSEGRPWPRLAIGLALTLALAPGLAQLRFQDDLKRLDGSRPETWRALEGFLARWGGFDASDFVVGVAADADAALARAAAVRAAAGLAPSLVEQLLPSAAEQERRRLAWNAFWNAEREPFAAALAAACAEVGLRAPAFAPALARYAPVDAVPPVTLETWRGTPMQDALGGLLRPVAGGWQAASPIELAEVSVAERALAERPVGGAWVASRTQLARHLVDVVRHDLGSLGAWMGVAMLLLVLVAERRARTVAAIVLPPFLALVWGFGTLGWIGQTLTPFSVIVAAFVAGIGLDAAVFLAEREHRPAALPPVLACSLTTMIGVGALVGADNPMLANVGIASLIGMAACVLACLLLTPALAGGGRGAAADRATARPDARASGNPGTP